MKNIILIPILLPAEDARKVDSIVMRPSDGRIALINVLTVESPQPCINQHLYLCSTLSIKEGEWMIDGSGKVRQSQRDLSEQEVKNSACKKIEFTTDQKLIADGVPAIDRNTKALVIQNKWAAHYEVNFLSEFVKRYNQKDKSSREVSMEWWNELPSAEKTLICDTNTETLGKVRRWETLTGGEVEMLYQENNQKETIMFDAKKPYIKKGVDVEKLLLDIKSYASEYGFPSELYNRIDKALQSQAGSFSLEDMVKCFYAGMKHECSKSEYPNCMDYLQSLTKEQLKGDIVIECEMEEIMTMDEFNQRVFTKKIKLEDEQPILIFK